MFGALRGFWDRVQDGFIVDIEQIVANFLPFLAEAQADKMEEGGVVGDRQVAFRNQADHG